MPEADLKAAFDAVMGNGKWYIYDHFGSSDIDTLLSKLRYLAVGLGCKAIVLDHISIVVSGLDESEGESERKVIDKLMTRLRSLIEETGILVGAGAARPTAATPGQGQKLQRGPPGQPHGPARFRAASNRCRTWWSALNATSRATSPTKRPSGS